MQTTQLERLVDEHATAPIDGARLRDRYRGVLLGVAAGNALGLPFEGQSRRAIERRFPKGVAEVDAAERDRPWDDDLAQTVIIAEALAASGQLELDDLAKRLVGWAEDNGRGIGYLTRQVISELSSGTPATEAARVVWEQSGWSTAGNGAVMRCAPVAMRWRTSGADLVRAARTSATVTHHDLRCEWSTVALVVALAVTLSGGVLDPEALAKALESTGGSEDMSVAIGEVVDAVRRSTASGLGEFELDNPADMGYTLKAMQVGLWCLRQEPRFEAVVTRVVSAGGDTDTNGAIAGAVMGARGGGGEIPSRWLENIPGVDRLVALADRLYEATTSKRP